MTLKDIATISGKPGLYKVVKPTRSGVIVEPLEGSKQKMVVRANQQLSILKEISIYTHGEEESVSLARVLLAIREKHGKEALPVSKKSDEADLRAFLETVVPDYDRERVYGSDIKKMVQWYGLLDRHLPEVLDGLAQEIAEDEEGDEESPADASGEEMQAAETPADGEATDSDGEKS